MIRRNSFRITVATPGATVTDTGPFNGIVRQMRWAPDSPDTGQPATIQLTALPKASDTGHGYLFYSSAGVNLGAGLTAQNAKIASGTGADTGAAFVFAAVGANERLQVKVVPADTGVNRIGNLYVWCEE